MKILVKFPSRSRPDRFFRSLDSLYQLCYNPADMYVLVAADVDDESMMNSFVYTKVVNEYKNIKIAYGKSDSKIHAINRHINELPKFWPEAADWDVIVVMSDDMMFLMPNWDEIIRTEIALGGLDTLLHIPDQDAKHLLATMYIAGRTFYERFGYVYDPRFLSLWCDNLVQDIAKKLRKYRYVDMPNVFAHLNPVYGHLKRDDMFDRQQADWGVDETMYRQIKSNGYELDKLKYL